MQLRIEHTWPLIGINRTPGQQSIDNTPSRFEMKSTQSTLSLEGEPVRVEIDQYPCRAETGLKNNFDLLKEAAERGRADALQGIGRRAAEGDEMAAIQTKANVFAAQAANLTLKAPAEFNIALMPESRPIINIVGGQSLEIQRGGVQITAVPGSVNIDYRPGTLEFYLAQKASLKMEFVGEAIDVKL